MTALLAFAAGCAFLIGLAFAVTWLAAPPRPSGFGFDPAPDELDPADVGLADDVGFNDT